MQITHRLILCNIAANKLFNKRIIVKGVLRKKNKFIGIIILDALYFNTKTYIFWKD